MPVLAIQSPARLIGALRHDFRLRHLMRTQSRPIATRDNRPGYRHQGRLDALSSPGNAVAHSSISRLPARVPRWRRANYRYTWQQVSPFRCSISTGSQGGARSCRRLRHRNGHASSPGVWDCGGGWGRTCATEARSGCWPHPCIWDGYDCGAPSGYFDIKETVADQPSGLS